MLNRINLSEPRMFYQPVIPFNQLYGLNDLCQLLKPNWTACEIGSFAGVSSNLIAKYVKKLYCVDLWQPYTEISEENLIEGEKRFNKVVKNNKNIIKIKQDSLEFLRDFEGKFDFIYLDGAHNYEQVKKEIQLALTKMDSGIIAGHDYKQILDVKHAVNECFPDKVINLYSDSSWSVYV